MVQISPVKDGIQYNLSIGYSNLLAGVYVNSQINLGAAQTATQTLMQWWSPKIAAGSDVYTNFICTQTPSAASVTTRNTSSDLTTLAASLSVALTQGAGTAVTLPANGDLTVLAGVQPADKLTAGCGYKVNLNSASGSTFFRPLQYGQTLFYRAGYKVMVADAPTTRSDALTSDLTFVVVDGAVALAVGAAISSVMVNFF